MELNGDNPFKLRWVVLHRIPAFAGMTMKVKRGLRPILHGEPLFKFIDGSRLPGSG